MEFELSTGRRVTLSGFFTGETSSWVDHRQESLVDKVTPVVRRVYPVGDFEVVGNTWLQCICIAGFNSTPVQDPDSFGSWLHLVWFVDDNDTSIRELVEVGLANCDWESQAHNFYRGPGDD